MVLKTTSESNILYLHFVDLNITKRTQSNATTLFANLVDGQMQQHFSNDPHLGGVTFFGSKGLSWISLLLTSHFLNQRRSVGSTIPI